MTAEKLQDAIGLLPADLLRETDKIRQAPRARVLSLRRWAALAAVLALVAGTTFVCQQNMGLEKMTETVSGPESPAAMAQAPLETQMAGEADAAPAEENAAAGTAKTEAEFFADHSHRFAEAEEGGRSTGAMCGNMEVTVDIDGARFTLAGSDAVRITDILVNLDYDPAQVCRCMAEFTVDTQTLTGIQVNLTEAFARCDRGQAALTEEQTQILQDIIDSLQ